MSFPNNASNVQPSTLFTSSFVEKLINSGVPPQCSSICISLANCTPASNAIAFVEAGRTNGAGEPLLLTLAVPSGAQVKPHMINESRDSALAEKEFERES